jgi:D-lactate dehydrogenase
VKKIVFFDIDEKEEVYFRRQLAHTACVFVSTSMQETTLTDEMLDADIISVFVHSNVTEELLSRFLQLSRIATRSTGVDHIDMAYCRTKGIEVLSVPSYGVHTIAEHTFALLLALTRHIVPSVERTRKGDFTLHDLQGRQLYDKTMGVIGTGAIGSVVCRIALGFGMQVVAYSHTVDEKLAEQGVRYMTLEELLGQSDVVSLHVPLNDATKHILSSTAFSQMKQGALLINTARGGLIDTQAMIEALERGILQGAALDVLEEECNIREERELLTKKFFETCDLKTQLLNHMLLTRQDVIITPHNAFNSPEALEEIMRQTVENIAAK